MQINLTTEQLNVLLAIIDCSSNEDEPDWFYDGKTDKIMTPFLDVNGNPRPWRTVQQHLDEMLTKSKYNDIYAI